MKYTMMSEGYGIIPKRFLRIPEISAYGKLIICYFMAHTGGGNWCFPSIARISKDLGLSRATVMRSLKLLEKDGIISREKLNPSNPESVNKYTVHFLTEIVSQRDGVVSLGDGGGITERRGVVSVGDPNINSLNNNRLKVTSKKEIPPKGDGVIPTSLVKASLIIPESFSESWTEWVAYRKERKLTCTPATLKKQIELLTACGDQATSIINQSITNGWQGLFPIKSDNKKSGFKSKDEQHIDKVSGILNKYKGQ
jgi:hypothetical protein